MALTRKNALFAGSDGGAESWAVIASLVESSKLNDVDPCPYLADTLAKIVDGHLASAIDELLPWAYARARRSKTRPESDAYGQAAVPQKGTRPEGGRLKRSVAPTEA